MIIAYIMLLLSCITIAVCSISLLATKDKLEYKVRELKYYIIASSIAFISSAFYIWELI